MHHSDGFLRPSPFPSTLLPSPEETPVSASGAGMRGHGHYGRVMLISAFNVGGNGTWHSVGSGEVGKEREIVLQSVLPEWDFELKTT